MKSKKLKETQKLGMFAKAKKYYGNHKKEINKYLILGLNIFVAVAIPFFLMSNTVLAGGTDANAKWDSVINFMTPWIQKLGGVVILIGAVQFGLGFKGEDSDGMTRGMKTAIAGLIVFAVGGASATFLA